MAAAFSAHRQITVDFETSKKAPLLENENSTQVRYIAKQEICKNIKAASWLRCALN